MNLKSSNWKTIIAAVLTAVCSVAGTLAYELPPGAFQRGAEAVSSVCQANGFPSTPEARTPPAAPADGAGKGQSPATPPSSPVPAPAAPVVPDPTWLSPYIISAQAGAGEQPWRWLGVAERWRGEARGWLA